jgi:hypothetical protein
VWDPHAFNIAGASNVHIEDVSVGPCPKCGGIGHIPDGIYSAATDTIEVVATSAKSAQSLATLLRLLQQARDTHTTADELVKALEKEEGANLKPVADLVRRLPKKLDIKYWVAIAISIVALLEGHATDQKVDSIKAEVDQIYTKVLTQHPVVSPVPIATPSGSAAFPKVGRNEPCPCGSGKKYKQCHGA